MKYFILSILALSTIVFAEDTHELQMSLYKKHRAMKHEEGKKWGNMRLECHKKYPQWTKTSSPDYDSHFKCNEEISDLEKAFDDKLQQELCQNIQTLCRT